MQALKQYMRKHDDEFLDLETVLVPPCSTMNYCST
jgi:hypothetical protein